VCLVIAGTLGDWSLTGEHGVAARLARSTLAPGDGRGKCKVVTTSVGDGEPADRTDEPSLECGSPVPASHLSTGLRLPAGCRRGSHQSIGAGARLPHTLKDQRRNKDGDEDEAFIAHDHAAAKGELDNLEHAERSPAIARGEHAVGETHPRRRRRESRRRARERVVARAARAGSFGAESTGSSAQGREGSIVAATISLILSMHR
jgi:hypothetical protein